MYQKKLSKENLKQNYFPCLLCSFGPEICEAIPRTCHDVTGYNDMITNGVWLKYINWDTRVNYKYSLCLNGDMCVCVCYFSVHRQTLQIKSKLLQNNFMSEKKVGHFPQGAMIVTFGEIIIQRKRQAYEFLFIYFQKLVCTQLLYFHWEAIAGSCWKYFTKWLKFFSRVSGAHTHTSNTARNNCHAIWWAESPYKRHAITIKWLAIAHIHNGTCTRLKAFCLDRR